MTDKIIWHVESRKVAELKPHPENPRIFTEKGMRDLKRSISSIGMAQPVNITPDGVILSGHARIMALQDQGVESVDVYVPNRELTAKEQQEVLIRMNANTAGEWDTKKMNDLFSGDDLSEWGADIPIVEEPLDKENPDADPEDFDIEKNKVKIVFYYGDSREIIDAFLREMKEKYPELLTKVEIDD